MAFKKAERKQRKARIALVGVAGSGKSLTALIWARVLSRGARFAVIDTERSSASIYAGMVPPGEKEPLDFDVDELTSYETDTYIERMHEAAKAGFPVLVIDSATHAWIGEGGILDQKDKMGGRFDAWAKLTPRQRQFLDCILAYPGHVIVTMRTRTKYVEEENDKGKTVFRRVGLEAQQKEGMEYEFDIFGMMNADNQLTIEKSRVLNVKELAVGAMHSKPGRALGEKLLAWCEEGGPAAAPPPMPKPEEPKGPPPTPQGSIAERIEAAKGKLAACKTKAEFDTFTALMKSPATPAEIRVALSADWIAKGSEFQADEQAPAAQ